MVLFWLNALLSGHLRYSTIRLLSVRLCACCVSVCTDPGSPPASITLASVTSFDHTSYCHFLRPSTPHSTRPVCRPTRMFRSTSVASTTDLQASKGLKTNIKRLNFCWTPETARFSRNEWHPLCSQYILKSWCFTFSFSTHLSFIKTLCYLHHKSILPSYVATRGLKSGSPCAGPHPGWTQGCVRRGIQCINPLLRSVKADSL